MELGPEDLLYSEAEEGEVEDDVRTEASEMSEMPDTDNEE